MERQIIIDNFVRARDEVQEYLSDIKTSFDKCCNLHLDNVTQAHVEYLTRIAHSLKQIT